MRFHSSRVMCHDDIRAIRRVYGFEVKRENNQFDDVCRRDFPMNRIQKIFIRIHRWICLPWGLIASLMIFSLTLIYLITKKRLFNEETSYSTSSSQSEQGEKSRLNAFLWHDDLPFN